MLRNKIKRNTTSHLFSGRRCVAIVDSLGWFAYSPDSDRTEWDEEGRDVEALVTLLVQYGYDVNSLEVLEM